MKTLDIDTALVREIIDRLTRIAELDRIILFGSGATGGMTPDSDIDLLVLRADVRDPRNESRRLREALIGLPVPFDILVMSTDRFEETKGVIGGVAYPANRYGKVIYEAA